MSNENAVKKEEPAKDGNIFSATVRVLGKPIRMVCDPIAQVCYPVLEEHWRERYRKPWPDKYARRMLIVDMVLITAIATLVMAAMVFAFVAPLFTLPPLVNIDVLGPKELVSGAATEYNVAYRNESDRLLGCAVLRLHLPAGTVLLEETPVPAPEAPASNEAACTVPAVLDGSVVVIESAGPDGPVVLVNIGAIQPRGRDLVRVHARTYGPTDSLKVMTAELLYWEEAKTAPIRVSGRQEWRVARSTVTLSAEHTRNLVRGRMHEVVYAYANASETVMGPLTLRLQAPDDFVITGTTPSLTGKSEWAVDALAPKEGGTLAVRGYFMDKPGSNPASIFTLGAYAHDGDEELLVESLRMNADPKTSGFELSQELVTPDRDALIPGETVKVAVRYRNDGASDLKDMTVVIKTDSRFIEAVSPAELRWDKTNAPELADVASGDSGTLNAEFRIVRDVTRGLLGDDAAPQLHLSTAATYFLPDEPANTLTVDTEARDLRIATRVGVQAAGLYFTKDGDQLGVGPLPPKVGETTKYRVFLDVSNTSGPADDVVLEAVLPPNAEWTGRYSVNAGEAIDWLPSTRTIRWEIGKLSAFTNIDGEHVGASFEVALTPREPDIGTAPTLVSGITLSGKDVFTGLQLHAAGETITTDLPFDKRAIGQGTVEK